MKPFAIPCIDELIGMYSAVLEVQELLEKTSAQHSAALGWYAEKRGETVRWSDIQAFSQDVSRLVNQAKGIYKPAYTDYALSIRTIQDGPYPDKDVEYRPDGSWVLHYFQENSDPGQRDREATNRGLMKCMEDGVPIGALVKRKPKPGVAYEVLGLGMVTSWDDGFFTIEGFSDSGAVHQRKDPDAASLRATKGTNIEPFDAENDRDLREMTMSQVAKRRGQAAFRAALLQAYGGKCCITGCTLEGALEAAHIAPHRGNHSQHVQNGLLLRCDIHTLFDLGFLAISDDYRVKLAPNAMKDAGYATLEGVQLALPGDQAQYPSIDAIQRHREWAGI